MSDITHRQPTAIDSRVRRLTVPVPSLADFQARYEQAVPPVPTDAVSRLITEGAPWEKMLELVRDAAPWDFLVYYRGDVSGVMRPAGDAAGCVSYLMGNHTIAERMFRHDPRVMLYAPLHTVIWEDGHGDAWFTVDQPSSQFASFDVPAITDVGLELDRKLAALLAHLEVPVPTELGAGHSAG